MMAAVADAREALAGVVAMLLGRSDFHGRFDVTSRGVWRSFLAALLAVPFALFDWWVQETLARQSEGSLGVVYEPYSLAYIALRWIAVWGYFPLLAALITGILGLKKGFAPWVVVHNWTHLFLTPLWAIPPALLVSGAKAGADALILPMALLQTYAYIRAAKSALGATWTIAIMTGCANVAAWLLVEMAARQAL